MTRRDHRTPRLGGLWIWLGLWPAGLAVGVSALADREKPPVTLADYARWETLAPGACALARRQVAGLRDHQGGRQVRDAGQGPRPGRRCQDQVIPFGAPPFSRTTHAGWPSRSARPRTSGSATRPRRHGRALRR